jgi:multidrug efflux pump subunit AcrA (membrane-fusion protein)
LVRASQASLDRLLALQAYEQVTAPFDGAITARNVDVGSLISATGASQGPTPTNPAAPTSNPAEPSDVPAAASFLGWQRLPGFAFWFRSPK